MNHYFLQRPVSRSLGNDLKLNAYIQHGYIFHIIRTYENKNAISKTGMAFFIAVYFIGISSFPNLQ